MNGRVGSRSPSPTASKERRHIVYMISGLSGSMAVWAWKLTSIWSPGSSPASTTVVSNVRPSSSERATSTLREPSRLGSLAWKV